jgi:hypothetical protein
MPKRRLGDSVDRFAGLLLSVCEKYPRLRFSVALPGYILECINPLILSTLRDMVKRGSVEWLCMGYTEPFLSFSPLRLTAENISVGTKLFAELTGEPPAGCVPPFSNWEPSHIDLFNAAGLKYAVISNELLAGSEADAAGYWITEYTGSSMAVFPARSCHSKNAPESLMSWISDNFTGGNKAEGAPRMIILKYLYALEDAGTQDWIERAAAEVDKHILELQPLRFKDVLGNIPPLGLHYFPSSLVPSHNEPATPYFLNHLHCYDQISVMQRKLMDAYDAVCELGETKAAAALRRLLFFAQDVNRFLPSGKSGFCSVPDRLWTYGKLIDAERGLGEGKDAQNCVIRLTDFLRNGYKSVIMANRALKLYLDHKNGAQVYELDYRERSFNACAGYNPAVRARPNVISPRESKLWFKDFILTEHSHVDGYINGTIKDCGNFAESPFEYTFKNSPSGVRLLLNCNGGFIDNGKNCPLSMDKVFGLDKDSAVLSFSYKLGNPSLTDYSFILGIEFPLALPGAACEKALIAGGKTKVAVNGQKPVVISDINEWEADDGEAGVRIEFVTQKNVDVHIIPNCTPAPSNLFSSGPALFVTCPVEIEKNSSQSFTGRVVFKKISRSGGDDTL